MRINNVGGGFGFFIFFPYRSYAVESVDRLEVIQIRISIQRKEC